MTSDEKINVLAWLHAELLHQLEHVFSTQQEHIATMGWLHAELVWQLQQVLGAQQALLQRAKALRIIKNKEAQQKAAQEHAGA